MNVHPKIRDDERSIFERPGTIKAIWVLLIGGCILSAALGFWYASKHELVHEPHFEDKTGVLGFLGQAADHFPVFYGLVGFVSFAFIVLAGQHLRKILMRPEGYYDGAEGGLPHNPVAADEARVEDIDTAPEGGRS